MRRFGHHFIHRYLATIARSEINFWAIDSARWAICVQIYRYTFGCPLNVAGH